jgi:hypothetical protein
MRARRKTRWLREAALLIAGAAIVLAAGCGEDFANDPRPPASVSLSGVINDRGVTISPDRIGAGALQITISNQTKAPHTVTLEGEPPKGNRVQERVGPVNPLDTATIQKTLRPGSYQVRAGSAAATPHELRPATLEVGRERHDSNSELLLP